MTFSSPSEETHLERKSRLPDFLKPIGRLLYGVISQETVYAIRGLLDFLARRVRGAPLARYSQVTPHLYVSGQHHKQGMKTLNRWGITGTLSMRSEYDDTAAGIAAPHHLHLATDDNTAPSLDDLKRGIAFITHEIEAGGKVYVHCAAGLGRAPMMAAAYLVSTGLTPLQAWAKIRDRRPFIRPTPQQIELIDTLSREVNHNEV